eukprot:m.77776 g.77776  ORF g.77776 m.77776 type:complete len:320 (-) comp19136_c0_seq1:262-1221(-)
MNTSGTTSCRPSFSLPAIATAATATAATATTTAAATATTPTAATTATTTTAAAHSCLLRRSAVAAPHHCVVVESLLREELLLLCGKVKVALALLARLQDPARGRLCHLRTGFALAFRGGLGALAGHVIVRPAVEASPAPSCGTTVALELLRRSAVVAPHHCGEIEPLLGEELLLLQCELELSLAVLANLHHRACCRGATCRLCRFGRWLAGRWLGCRCTNVVVKREFHVFGVRDVEHRCVCPGLSQFEAGRSRFFFFVVIRAVLLIIIALRSVITGSCFSTGGGLFVLIIVVGVLLAVVFVVIVVLGGHRGLEGHRLLL